MNAANWIVLHRTITGDSSPEMKSLARSPLSPRIVPCLAVAPEGLRSHLRHVEPLKILFNTERVPWVATMRARAARNGPCPGLVTLNEISFLLTQGKTSLLYSNCGGGGGVI